LVSFSIRFDSFETMLGTHVNIRPKILSDIRLRRVLRNNDRVVNLLLSGMVDGLDSSLVEDLPLHRRNETKPESVESFERVEAMRGEKERAIRKGEKELTSIKYFFNPATQSLVARMF